MTSAKKQHRLISPMPVVSSFPPLKPVSGWPGYFVSEDGQVYSTRDSTSRKYRPVKVNKYGKVAMHRPGQYKHMRPEELAAEAWRPRWHDKEQVTNE